MLSYDVNGAVIFVSTIFAGQVLFPLLHLLLENIDAGDPHGIEETRMRASTLLCKVRMRASTLLCKVRMRTSTLLCKVRMRVSTLLCKVSMFLL